MKISEELEAKITILFKNNNELKEKLLSGNPDAIREVGSMSQKGIAPEEIVAAYENGKIEGIYKKSKMMLELQKLYRELCLECSKAIRNKSNMGR